MRGNLSVLEEPELGIHPHQLQLLMNFIRAQAKEKQIILTTHSPQVLDILETDELDRVIITTFDPKKGSQFRNLTEKEISDAQNFMSDMYLSAHILADLEAFNAFMKTEISPVADPMLSENPRLYLKSHSAYTEGQCPTLLKQIRVVKVAANCRYFPELLQIFEQNIA